MTMNDATNDSRMAELEAENGRLREALAGKIDAATMLRELTIRDGGLYAEIEGGAAGLLAGAFVDMFDKHPPQECRNYIEVSFGSRLGTIVVTVQKCSGKTPSALRLEAERQRDSVRGVLEQVLADARAQGVLVEWQSQMEGALATNGAPAEVGQAGG